MIGTAVSGLVFFKIICPVKRALEVFSLFFPSFLLLLLILNLIFLMRSNLF